MFSNSVQKMRFLINSRVLKKTLQVFFQKNLQDFPKLNNFPKKLNNFPKNSMLQRLPASVGNIPSSPLATISGLRKTPGRGGIFPDSGN